MEAHAPGINPIHVVLDALVPSAFRSFTRPKPATWRQFRLAPPLDYLSGPARAIFASRNRDLGGLLLKAIDAMLFDAMRVGLLGQMNLGYSDTLLAPGSTVAAVMLDLIAIAQHYEYGSIMVDVSTSIDASAWFATRDWETGRVAASDDGSPGIIYRIDAKKLVGILDRHVKGEGALAPPAMQAFGVFGLADISDRFAFLDRPQRQHGGSLLGMENVIIHYLMHINKAIEVFPFDHASVTGSETSLGRDDICPPSDHGVEIFRPSAKYSADPVKSDELRGFLSWMEEEPGRINHLAEMRDAGII
jgi:hypothetical protein